MYATMYDMLWIYVMTVWYECYECYVYVLREG